MTNKHKMYKSAGEPVKFRTNSAGKVVELWIERSRWARTLYKDDMNQKPNGPSSLLNDVGGMCCLGFYARACGVPVTKVFSRGTPSTLFYATAKKYPDQMKWLMTGGTNSFDGNALMGLNDQDHLALRKPKEQERGIREVFAENGVKIRFVK